MVARLVAVLAVLPLVAPGVWSGFRLGVSDAVLAVIAATEQPLSVRSATGVWAIALAAAWFGLAYWRRDVRRWEPLLVLAGGAVALTRTGNAWLDAVLLVPPLARQLACAKPPAALLGAIGAVSIGVAGLSLAFTRPPALPDAAARAAMASATPGAALADWRWGPDLGQRLSDARQVLTAGGLYARADPFWLDYLRVSQGHARWDDVLEQQGVGLVVLDAADQQAKGADLIRAATDWRVLYDADGALVAERRRP